MEQESNIKEIEKSEIREAFEDVGDSARGDAMKEISFQTKLIKLFR